MDFETWLNQCPDPSKFAIEYVDIRSDILNVIDTYNRPEWKKVNFNKDKLDDLVYQVYDQDWSEWNDFIAYLIDNEVTWS